VDAALTSGAEREVQVAGHAIAELPAASGLAHNHAANRVTRAKGANNAGFAALDVGLIAVKSNDGARRGGVGKFVQDDRRFVGAGIAPEQAADDELVHGQIGLV